MIIFSVVKFSSRFKVCVFLCVACLAWEPVLIISLSTMQFLGYIQYYFVVDSMFIFP